LLAARVAIEDLDGAVFTDPRPVHVEPREQLEAGAERIRQGRPSRPLASFMTSGLGRVRRR
jgi:hypothetical protein